MNHLFRNLSILLPYREAKLKLSIDTIKFDRVLSQIIASGLQIRSQSIWENHREYRVSAQDKELKIVGPFGGSRQWCLLTRVKIEQNGRNTDLSLKMRLCNEHIFILVGTIGFMLFVFTQVFRNIDITTSVLKIHMLFPIIFIYIAIVWIVRYETNIIIQLLDRTFKQ
jgi:hypothetical protein